jgi:sec-independent protein translocase protein TatA
MPFGIGPLELGIVAAIGLLIFGPRRLPELGRGLGSGLREFKDGISQAKDLATVELEPDREPIVVKREHNPYA